MSQMYKRMLYYTVQRVIPEVNFSYYKDIYRHVENLCSSKLDGFIRQSDINRLPKSLCSTMQVMFTRFARPFDSDELSLCLDKEEENDSTCYNGAAGSAGLLIVNMYR